MTNRYSLPEPKRVADTDTYDGAVSQLAHTTDGTVLLIYHTSQTGHVAPDGHLVVRHSSDKGNTWSDPEPVMKRKGVDPSSFSVVHETSSSRIIVFAVGYAFSNDYSSGTFPEREFVGTYKLVSNDGGQTWSNKGTIDQSLTINTAAPFGGSVATRNGLLTVFQSDAHELEVLISDDNGESWDQNVFVASSPKSHQLAEPVPCAVSREKTLIFGRDNETGGIYAIRSHDGGLSWEDPVFFSITSGEEPNPIWIKKTGANELTAVWGDRTDHRIYQASISAQLAWQDPTALSRQHQKCLHQQIGDTNRTSYWNGDAGDFGYPTFIQFGQTGSDSLLVCYDENKRPNLWQMALI